MTLLERKLGRELAYTHLHRVQRYLKTENTFLGSIDIILFELDELNTILFSLSDRYPSAPYWIDSEKELSEKLMPRAAGYSLNVNQFGHAKIILNHLTSSIQTVIANELLEYAFIPVSLNISEQLKFIIEYNSVLLTMKDYFRSAQLTLDLTKDAIENTIQRNEPYLMTKLAQLPAMRVKSVVDLHTITKESLVPQVTR